jgi:hypothetical protein
VSRASETIARHELVAAALALGIERPDELSTDALTDAVARASEIGDVGPERAADSGWFAVARHLVTTVVEQGLNLPSAAKMLRTVGGSLLSSGGRARSPLPTVTLAQIYMTQGHDARARATLDQVLERQPDHPKARQLLDVLDRGSQTEQPPASAPEEPASAPEEERVAVSVPATGSAAAANPTPPATPPARARSDLLVALLCDGSARLGWQLGPVGEQLVADQGVEILVRVVRARPLGPVVSEFRHPISATSGIRSVSVPEGAALCAALCDVQGTTGVLGVASVFDVNGRVLPGADASLATDPAVLGLAEHVLGAAV